MDKKDEFENISRDIADKINKYMSENEDIKNIHDGVGMNDGGMGIERTRDMTQDIEDSVFSQDSYARKEPVIQKPYKVDIDKDFAPSPEDGPEGVYLVDEEDPEDEDEFESRNDPRTDEFDDEYYDDDEDFDDEDEFGDEDYDDEDDDDGGSRRKSGAVIAAVITAAVIFVALVLWVFLFDGLGIKKNREAAETTPEETSAADVISCSVSDRQELTAPAEIVLESAQGLRMYYTLDGSDPSISSRRYIEPVEITESSIKGHEAQYTLKVVSYTSNSIKSGELEVTFKVSVEAVEPPHISPQSGNYDTERDIVVVAEDGADIYYTYDGSTPSVFSTLYNGPVRMEKGNRIFSAIAVKNGRESEPATAIFNFEIGRASCRERV